MNHALAVFSPNAVLNKNAVRALIAFQVVIVMLLWIFSPFVLLPKPGEVLNAFGDLWEQGLGAELITSFYLNLQAIAVSTVVIAAAGLRDGDALLPPHRRLAQQAAFSVAGGVDFLLHADGQERP
jgi:hypothetical protein